MDYPDGSRKIQKVAIPKIGGLAVALVFSISALSIPYIFSNNWNSDLFISIVLPALLAGLIGFMDDIRSIAPILRIGLQVLIGACALILGTQVSIFESKFINVICTLLWFVFLINAFNLFDNADGLASLTIIFSTTVGTLIAYLSGQTLVYILGISLIGISLGFFLFNWNPARVYLGDSGVYFLATVLGIFLIRIRPTSLDLNESFLILILLVTIPVVDMTYVTINRLRLGIHPFTAGRDHLSHLLNSRGFSVKRSVIFLQLFHVLFCLIALFIFLM